MGTVLHLYILAVSIVLSVAYRLPTSVVPRDYKLEIITNLGDEGGKFNFTGKVWIDVTCIETTHNITLHAKKLSIDKHHVEVKNLNSKESGHAKISSVELQTEDEFLIINLKTPLKEGHQYEIFIPFHGIIEEGLAGYYRSQYTDKATKQTRWLAVTQFEPSDARRAFPCFDEPAMKAKFTISLGRSVKYTSISNMPLVKTEKMKGRAGWEWDRYETSVPMSTYLVAYIVSDYHSVVSSHNSIENNVTFKIWARKDALGQVDFANEIGPKILEFYEKYFDIKYPLPKQDMVAVPDFSAGAMENWGLITYRETYLLYDPKVSSIINKMSVASVVAHELAHQWFGNLVTMKWWTDLWLNEGFATYMAAVAVADLVPEWNSLAEETTDNILAVLNFDALHTSHPVSAPIGNPKEISEIFDTISYKKGSFLLHMMSNFLGKDVLRAGVSNYLKGHKYDNAEQDDLWTTVTREAHLKKALPSTLTVKDVMDTWTLKTGYPVLHATRKYNHGHKGTTEIKQERFLRDRHLDKSTNEKWWVPVSYGTEKELSGNHTDMKPRLWLSPKDDVKEIETKAGDDDWVIFNVRAAGLYRVNYDQKNWNLLIETLNSSNYKNIPLMNRILLIDDSASLAWIGKLNYKNFFNILTYLERETEYLPWKVALRNIGSIDILLKRTSSYGQYKGYIQKLLEHIYERIGGFQEILERDNRVDAIQHRSLITLNACKYDSEECVVAARDLFKDIEQNPEKNQNLAKDIRGVVYCMGVKYGGEKEWMFLWNLYLSSNVASEKNLILRNLGCTRHSWLLQRYLEWSLDTKSGIRKQDVVTVFAGVIANDLGYHVAQSFVHDNIKSIHDRVQPSINKLTSILTSLATYITRQSEYDRLKTFTEQNHEYFKEIKNGVKQALETAKLNAQWHQDNLKDVRQILKEYKQ